MVRMIGHNHNRRFTSPIIIIFFTEMLALEFEAPAASPSSLICFAQMPLPAKSFVDASRDDEMRQSAYSQ